MDYAQHFLKLAKLQKVAMIKTDLMPSQKMPYMYLAEWEGQKIIIVDTLLVNEDKYPEPFTILHIRALVRAGVKQFYVFAPTISLEPTLKIGDVMLISNFLPINPVNPFIGMHHDK
jgi:hypothetical protein